MSCHESVHPHLNSPLARAEHLPKRKVQPPGPWLACIGLGLKVTTRASGVCRSGGKLFVPDRDIRWLGLIDVPAQYVHRHRPRLRWANIFRTHIRFGMPTLGCASVLDVSPRSTSNSELLEILNRMNRMMSNSDFDSSQPRQGRPGSRWMPIPYLGFKAVHRDRIFDWASHSGFSAGGVHYPDQLKRQFCTDIARSMPVTASCSGKFASVRLSHFHGIPTRDLMFVRSDGSRHVVRVTRQASIHILSSQPVREGDLVANDGLKSLSELWGKYSINDQWYILLPQLVPPTHFNASVRLWFERQLVHLAPGFVHIRADLAAPAARGHAVDEQLHWELSDALNHYDESADVFFFPPFASRHWQSLRGLLRGEVAYDFTPTRTGAISCASFQRYRKRRPQRIDAQPCEPRLSSTEPEPAVRAKDALAGFLSCAGGRLIISRVPKSTEAPFGSMCPNGELEVHSVETEAVRHRTTGLPITRRGVRKSS